MLVFSGAIPLLFNGLYCLLATPDWRNIELLAGYDAILVGVGIVHLSGAWRGTWVLDEERVVFQPRRGPPKSLGWTEVGMVLWGPSPVPVGRGVSIKLLWVRFSAAQRREARTFAESKLSAAFDLKPIEPIPAGPPVQWDLEDAWTKLVVFAFVGLPLALLVLMIAVLAAPWQAVATLSRILWWVMGLFLIMPVFWSALFFWEHERQIRPRRNALLQIHPAWPWRLRREAVASNQKQELSKLDLDDWSL